MTREGGQAPVRGKDQGEHATSHDNLHRVLSCRARSGGDQHHRWRRRTPHIPRPGTALAAGHRRRDKRFRPAPGLLHGHMGEPKRVDPGATMALVARGPETGRWLARRAAAELVWEPRLRRPGAVACSLRYLAAVGAPVPDPAR